MRHVHFLLVIVGQAAQVIKFVHIHYQVWKAVYNLRRLTVRKSEFLLKNLDHAIERFVNCVEVHVSAGILIRSELDEQDCVWCCSGWHFLFIWF